MNPFWLGFYSGAFIAVLLITCLLYALAFKWETSYAKSLLLNGASFVIATIISAYGAADGGPPNFRNAQVYFLAQVLVLAVDLYRIHRKFSRQEPPKARS